MYSKNKYCKKSRTQNNNFRIVYTDLIVHLPKIFYSYKIPEDDLLWSKYRLRRWKII